MSATDDATRAVIAAWERLADPAGLLEWLEAHPPETTIGAFSPAMAASKAAEAYLGAKWRLTIMVVLKRHPAIPGTRVAVLSALPEELPAPQLLAPAWLSRVVADGMECGGTQLAFTPAHLADLIRASLAAEGEQP